MYKQIYFLPALLIVFCLNGFCQNSENYLPLPSKYRDMDNMQNLIKSRLDNYPNIHCEMPIGDEYQKPFLIQDSQSRLSDSTPPSAPVIIKIKKESIHSCYIKWNPSIDPESGIDIYGFGVGSTPGTANLRWWQSNGTSTQSGVISMNELGITEGTTFYITIFAANGAGLQSVFTSTQALSFVWEDLGLPQNDLTVAFSTYGFATDGSTLIAGWDPQFQNKMQFFIQRMIPIIKDIYGPPSQNDTVTFVRNLYYNQTNIYFTGTNEIHQADNFNPQLITHELIHAFHGNVIFSVDSLWKSNSKLSGFEESFAQGLSYICMNRYRQNYPNDTLIDHNTLWGSSMLWDYDFRNISQITTEDFFSDSRGMGIYWDRYELAAAASIKAYTEDSLFFKNVNLSYYQLLNSNHALVPNRNMIVNLFGSAVPQVEGYPTSTWINMQRIYDCHFVPGKKVWTFLQHYPSWMDYMIFNRLLHYETFSNGSDWAYLDSTGQAFVYYNLNGSTGTATLKKYDGSIVDQRNVQTLPACNPPICMGYGVQNYNLTADNDVQPWPNSDSLNCVFSLTDFGLYTLDVTIGNTNGKFYRVIGDTLRNTLGIYGGLLHANGGSITIDHENFPPSPSMPIINGAFYGHRDWASSPDFFAATGRWRSYPGRLFITYTDALGNIYKTQRNIDYGSIGGNHVFLFDTELMILQNITAIENIQELTAYVYPSPATDKINIQLSGKTVDRFILNLCDLTGKSILNQKVNGNFTTLDIGHLASGVYFLQIDSNDLKKTFKIIRR